MNDIKNGLLVKNVVIFLQKNSQSLICALGGIVFLAVFYWRYSGIDPGLYEFRDDGVITLSHAKNLVDYGFIGVSPSGERVEGYSAPVEFFLYAFLYWLTGMDFHFYIKTQTFFCTFFLGAGLAYFFSINKYYAVFFSIFSALILSSLSSFIEWHGSGMENAITHVLFLFSACIFFYFSRRRDINYKLSVIIFLASVSRIDSIYHLFPWMVIFAVYWLIFEKNFRGFFLLLIIMGLWVFYNIWRYCYFGSILPNTAFAQDISIGNRISDLLHFKDAFINDSLSMSKIIFAYHGGYFLLMAVPFIVFVEWKKEYALIFLLAISLFLTAWLNPFIFGPTRLELTRTTTQMAIFVCVALGVVFYLLNSARLTLILVLFSPLIFLVYKINYVPPYYLCCDIGDFENTRKVFFNLSKRENLPRPTISNPDLGVISWHKQFNIVDLGMLGSTIMAKLKNDSVSANYFFEYAAPDLIETHNYWSCMYYSSLFEDSRFNERYQVEVGGLVTSDYCGAKPLPDGIWIRKDILKSAATRERNLIDDLENSLSLTRIKEELNFCKNSTGNEPQRCAYVTRTSYRFLPEIRKNGQLVQLVALFEDSPSKDFDRYLLAGFEGRKNYQSAIDFILQTSPESQ